MKSLKADLHIHTVLSPCATLEMLPPYIVERACETNIQLIAITDHNSSAKRSGCHQSRCGQKPDRFAWNGTYDRRRNPCSLSLRHLCAARRAPKRLSTTTYRISPTILIFFGMQFDRRLRG